MPIEIEKKYLKVIRIMLDQIDADFFIQELQRLFSPVVDEQILAEFVANYPTLHKIYLEVIE